MDRAVSCFHRCRAKRAFVEVAAYQIIQALAADEMPTRDESSGVTPDLIGQHKSSHI
jgi:hypothetical protein